MRSDIDTTLRNAKKIEIPDSTIDKVDIVLRGLKPQRDTAHTKTVNKKVAIIAAVAAVIAIMIAYPLLPAPINNSFTAQARAVLYHDIVLHSDTMALHTDGRQIEFNFSATREFGMWAGFYDGEHMYLSIALDVTGENIKSAEFSVTSGFFARQRVDSENVLIITLDEYGNESAPLIFGTEFESLGNRLTLEDMQAENYSFSLAVPFNHRLSFGGNSDHCLENLQVHVDVLFNNGHLQSDTIALDFGDGGAVISFSQDMGTLGEFSFYRMNLDEATLIPESVHVLPLRENFYDSFGRWRTEMHVWEREDRTIYACTVLFRNDGDEERYMFSMVGGNAVMPVIRLSANGNLIAMEYILPNEVARMFREYWVDSVYMLPEGWLDDLLDGLYD
ncbi:MAG: hypothetical protein FWC20_01515 [Oscillospiraceae bacterium]|nr:hypothetical protein [Oscillospiraceae bacterium]MCL2278071.1 hypothetical protein [Oscillospiraceae bacterium]